MWNTSDSHPKIEQEDGRTGEIIVFVLNKLYSLSPFLLFDLHGGCRGLIRGV
jgi:hypothetical protein